MWASFSLYYTRKATNWITIYWVVYRAIADSFIMHFANYGFESVDVLRWVTIKFDISNVPSITEIVVWRLDINFIKGRNWIVNWHMEGIGIKIPICYALNFAKFFSINLGKPPRNPLSRRREK